MEISTQPCHLDIDFYKSFSKRQQERALAIASIVNQKLEKVAKLAKVANIAKLAKVARVARLL